MVTGKQRVDLNDCLEEVKKAIDTKYPQDYPISLFIFEPMVAHGCSGHPSVEDHQIISEQLTPFFYKILSDIKAKTNENAKN